jgi:preprotein translocase subunit SecG
MKWTVSLLVGVGIIVVGFRFWGPLLTAFFVMNCLVLIIVVLLQSGKAADLAGAFGGAGSQTAFGPRGAANVLSRVTTWCAIMFMICAMALVLRTDKSAGQGGSILEQFSKPASKPSPVIPAKPQAPAPQSGAPQSNSPAPQNSAPATPPASQQKQQPPANSQPAPTQPKKP